ncbi:MAG: hypothetical protein RLZ45_381 [Verrucomicrobiota bacterium]|jgi:general secretion pathway protein K
MKRTSTHAGVPHQRGVALLIVLLTLFTLGGMAAVFAYSMKVETRLAMNTSNAGELEWMGRSGVEYAKWILMQQDRVGNERGFHALNQFWAGGPGPIESADNPFEGLSLVDVPLGAGQISIEIRDTERLLNINREARNPLLMDLALARAGADATDTAVITGALADWIDRDDFAQAGNGAESDHYLSLDPPYRAKNGPIDDIRELLLVRGVTPSIFWGGGYRSTEFGNGSGTPAARMGRNSTGQGVGLAEMFGALSSGRVNINTAPLAVLALLLGGDESLAEQAIRVRAGQDGQDGTEDDQPARSVGEIARLLGPAAAMGQDRFVTQSMTFEVRTTVKLGPAKRRFSSVVRRVGARDLQVLLFRPE